MIKFENQFKNHIDLKIIFQGNKHSMVCQVLFLSKYCLHFRLIKFSRIYLHQDSSETKEDDRPKKLAFISKDR